MNENISSVNEAYRPRMRTIDQAMEYFKSVDPNTALNKSALRRLVTTKKIPGVVMVGNKYLINVDILERFFQGDCKVDDLGRKII